MQARSDARHLSEDNAQLQKQLSRAQAAARSMVALVYEHSASKENNTPDIKDILNAPDCDLPLDKLLEGITTLLRHS